MARWEDWQRTRHDLDTPPDRYQQALARKVLGELMEGIQRGGLFQNKIRRTFADGTVVVAQFDGVTPMVEVFAPGGSSESGCQCVGLKGSLSSGRTVLDWPADQFNPDQTPALFRWHVGALDEDVFLWTTYSDKRFFRLDTAAPKMLYVKTLDPALLGLPAFTEQFDLMAIYHTDQFGPVMHIPGFQGGFVDGNPVVSNWYWAALDGSLYSYISFFPGEEVRNHFWVSPFTRGRAPTVLNCGERPGWTPSRTWPQVYQQLNDIVVTTTVTDGKTFSLNSPVHFTMQDALDSHVAVVADDGPDVIWVGQRQDTAGGRIANDMYRVDLRSLKITTATLDVPLYPGLNLTAQICDTYLIAGGTQADGTASGDVWLWQVGGAARKIGTIPELASANALTFGGYAIPTAHAVHILAPVYGVNVDGSATPVGYKLYTVT